MSDDDFPAFRGLIHGILLSIPLWAIVLLLLWGASRLIWG